MLTTTGSITGKARTVVLVYVEHAGAWVVVASNMGSHRPPAWLANLRAAPAATVTIGDRTVPVRAREATRGEHDALWPLVDRANYGQYGRYQAIASRTIPLVILEPTGTDRDRPAGTGRDRLTGTGRGGTRRATPGAPAPVTP